LKNVIGTIGQTLAGSNQGLALACCLNKLYRIAEARGAWTICIDVSNILTDDDGKVVQAVIVQQSHVTGKITFAEVKEE